MPLKTPQKMTPNNVANLRGACGANRMGAENNVSVYRRSGMPSKEKEQAKNIHS